MIVRSSFPEYDGIFYEPPWEAFPPQREYKDFWTEGTGKDYYEKYKPWYYKLSPAARKEYDKYFVLPEKWKKFREEYHL